LCSGQTLRVDPQHERLLGIEDDYPSAAAIPSALATSSENNRLSAISIVYQALTPIRASNSAYPNWQLKSAYGRVGPLHDLSRQEPSQDSEAGAPQPAQSINLPPHTLSILRQPPFQPSSRRTFGTLHSRLHKPAAYTERGDACGPPLLSV
jgi:hypothetical protein